MSTGRLVVHPLRRDPDNRGWWMAHDALAKATCARVSRPKFWLFGPIVWRVRLTVLERVKAR